MESMIYSQIIMKKRLNQIKEKSQRLHIRKELVLSYEKNMIMYSLMSLVKYACLYTFVDGSLFEWKFIF